ncbi:MAG: hypothetical protein KDK23_15565, partial [Leptospiraceae bacterium]|nr:hypothetical protein [Leptospiraceae bacterium]
MFDCKHDEKKPGLKFYSGPSTGAVRTFWRGLTILLALPFLALLAGCTDLKVPPLVEKGFLIAPPAQGPSVQLQWKGEGLEDSEWIRSYTNYRIIYDDVENTTGSIRKLLEPALLQTLHRNEMRLQNRDALLPENAELLQAYGEPQNKADCTWTIEVRERTISHYPRREFIQTAQGIRPDHIVILFKYSYCLGNNCKDYKIERTSTAYADEARNRLQMEAGLVLKQMQDDAY